jgi:hypothetical protein
MLEAGLDVLLTEESLIPGRGLLVGDDSNASGNHAIQEKENSGLARARVLPEYPRAPCLKRILERMEVCNVSSLKVFHRLL